VQIIDAQIHAWGTGLPSNAAHWQITSFTPREAVALMYEAGVDGTVIQPPGWDPKSTEMAFDAVRSWPGPLSHHGISALDKPDDTRARLSAWRSQAGMLGLRWPSHPSRRPRWTIMLADVAVADHVRSQGHRGGVAIWSVPDRFCRRA